MDNVDRVTINDNIQYHPDRLKTIEDKLKILDDANKISSKKRRRYTTDRILSDMNKINNNEKLKSRRKKKIIIKDYNTLVEQEKKIKSIEKRLIALEKQCEENKKEIDIPNKYIKDSLCDEDNDNSSNDEDIKKMSIDDRIKNTTIYANLKRKSDGRYVIDQPFDILDQKNIRSLKLKKKIMKLPVFNRRNINTRNPTILKVICDFVANRFCRLPKHNKKLRDSMSYKNITGKDVFMSGDLKNNAIEGTPVDYDNEKVSLTSSLSKIADESNYHQQFIDSIVEGNINKYEQFLYERIGYINVARGKNSM